MFSEPLVELEHLNDDTTWLLSLRLPSSPRVFRIIIDPWLTGSQTDYSRFFSRQHHASPPIHTSLASFAPLDLILISHEFSDHCHVPTLRTAAELPVVPPVIAHPYAVAAVRAVGIFGERVRSIPVAGKATGNDGTSLAQLFATQTGKHPHHLEGSLNPQFTNTIQALYIPSHNRWDLAGIRLHGATIITFFLSPTPDSPAQEYAIIYAPHGLPPSSLSPWVLAHPHTVCLALVHGMDEIDNPWYLAGPLNLGIRTGPGIVHATGARYWICTHDEHKRAEGFVSRVLRRRSHSIAECERLLLSPTANEAPNTRNNNGTAKVVKLSAGERIALL